MAKRPSVFGYAWRGFRLLRHWGKLSVDGAGRRAGVSKHVVIYSETREGNIDFVVADRLLKAYRASVVELGLLTQLAEKHLAATGEKTLRAPLIVAILAEFEQVRDQASPQTVPMPEPAGLLVEIDRRIAPVETLFHQAFRGLEALRSTLPTIARHLGAEWQLGAGPELDRSRLPFQWSRDEEIADRLRGAGR